MSKKKLNLLISVSLILFYLISAFFIFTFENKRIGNDFQNYYLQLSNRYIASDNLEYETVDDFMFDITQSTRDYPYIITLYDHDTLDVIAQSGSMLQILGISEQNRYCYLDEYITDDNSKLFLRKENEHDFVTDLTYYEKDGNIIPVKMTLAQLVSYDGEEKKENQREIVFSNQADNTLYYDFVSDETEESCLYEFIDVDRQSFRHRNYEYLRNNLDTMLINKDSFDKGIYGPEEISAFSFVNFKNGKSYYISIQAQITPFLETVTSMNFKSAVSELSIMFLMISIVIFITANKYYNKNKKLNEAKYAFTNAAAHELKTPLAVIENQCECILENVNEEKNPEYVKSIYEESIRMTQLVNNMLKFNKLSTTDQIEKENTSLTDIVKLEMDKYSSFINTRGHKVSADIDNVTIKCSSELIQLAVDNYISNAVKYASVNTEIEIRLKKEGNTCRFSVLNVVDKPLTDEVWDSFYMGDKSREGKSAGMGLAITKQILELHHYKYGFENKANTVEFYFIAK